MIFCSKNEDGIPAWKLVLEGKKTVTRRLNPEKVGSSRAVCPGRGKKAVCRILIKSCELDEDWDAEQTDETREEDGRREGFRTYGGLWDWLISHGVMEAGPLYRIEFEVIGQTAMVKP